MRCLCLSQSLLADAIQTAKDYQSLIDMVELRVDLLEEASLPTVLSFPRGIPSSLGSICTIRRKEDGGHWIGKEKLRRKFLLDVLQKSRFDWVDVEEDWWHQVPKRTWKSQVLCSLHDLQGIPDDLEARAVRMAHSAAAIKIAVYLASSEEVLSFLRSIERLRSLPGKKIFIAMGTFGLFSRILNARLGSEWTYASAGDSVLAPGQLSVETLVHTYKHHKIQAQTKVFAIIGNPLTHTQSPAYHNDVFAKNDLNACYVPLQTDNMAACFSIARLLPLQGFSVTVPYKQQVLPYLSSMDRATRAIAACNTVVAEHAGWRGSNTDVEGFMAPLRRMSLTPHATVLVIGAGGAARAVVYALLAQKHKVYVVNRSAHRAISLVEDFQHYGDISALDYAHVAEYHYDLIVQTTPVGMHPRSDEDALVDFSFRGSELVYDLIYNPLKTPFLRRAESSGCRIISGIEMFHAQATLQAESFAGLID